ncbi:alpha/beta fold hydrolase [Phytohabitans sp. LJ34]|uniref:alpha/beta fold hydrolase n=1 Tax=Phytohabitans sp. LJ34 TaxID=3452217 RepID=UPI003F89451E
MARYVLVPGAGGAAFYWHRVAPLLRGGGHDVVAVDLPAGDDAAGLEEYADVVVEAIGGRTGGIVLVGQSMGGLSAPLVAARVPVDLMVLLNAMIPRPGESGGEWWENTGQAAASAEMAAREGRSAEFDLETWFFHDVPAEVTAAVLARGEPSQSGTPFEKPWPLDAWPDVPTRLLQARDDRLFPLEFQRRQARERLGIEIDVMPGGHLVALSRPAELAERLERYRTEAGLA